MWHEQRESTAKRLRFLLSTNFLKDYVLSGGTPSDPSVLSLGLIPRAMRVSYHQVFFYLSSLYKKKCYLSYKKINHKLLTSVFQLSVQGRHDCSIISASFPCFAVTSHYSGDDLSCNQARKPRHIALYKYFQVGCTFVSIWGKVNFSFSFLYVKFKTSRTFPNGREDKIEFEMLRGE